MTSIGSTVLDSDTLPGLDPISTAIDALITQLGDGALHTASHDQLTGTAVALRAIQARIESMLLHVVRTVDLTHSYATEGLLGPVPWLRMHTRMTPAEAGRCVRTARALASGQLDATAAALAAGEIDPAHVHAIVQGIKDAPAGAVELIEPEALAAAREADPRAVTEVMTRFVHALDPDGADEKALRRLEKRGLTTYPTPDGMIAGNFLADPESGSQILTALDAASPVVTDDERTGAQRRMDALVEVCRHYLASPGIPQTGGGHPHVIITMDAATASAAPGQTGSPGATMSWVGTVPGSTARRVACDAEVTTVTLDEHGTVTDTKKDNRYFSHAQRLAMIARDGDRCWLPWCDRPVSWADGHHLIPWTHGGPTTVANGMLICRKHHTMLHEGHWTVTRLADGRYQLHHHDGRVIGPEPHPPGHNRPTPHRRE